MKSDTTRNYWRSRAELQHTPAYQAEVANEFQEELDISAPEPDGTSRRGFLGWVGASLAASGLTGCDIIRRPVERILPYSRAPEEFLPGIPQYYATAAQVAGEVVGMLVENHEGRPTKVEGNPVHRGNYGGLSNLQQSIIFDLYDPQRLRAPSAGGHRQTLSDAKIHVKVRAAALKSENKRVAVLAESSTSVQRARLRDQLLSEFKGSEWFTYESVSDDNQRAGMKMVFNEPLRPRYSFAEKGEGDKFTPKAKVIVSLDNDFLGTEALSVAYSREWVETRRVDGVDVKDASMSRLYAVEARYSLTGSNADHRVRLQHAQVESFAISIAKQLGISVGDAGAAQLNGEHAKIASCIVDDLQKYQGAGLVLAGRNQPPVVHALAALINEKLGAHGNLVKYYPDVRRRGDAAGDMESISTLAKRLDAGQVDALIILGGNPAYSAPADLEFAQKLAKAGEVIYLADQSNETTESLSASSKASLSVIPRSHALEAWGDVVGLDGQVSIQQPMVQPLHESISEIELLSAFLGQEAKGYQIVRKAWREKVGSVGFHKLWRRWLHAGVLEDGQVAFPASSKKPSNSGGLKPSGAVASKDDQMDVLFYAGYNSYDGRYANNPWLQELPDPMTKITWDNAAILGPKTARKLGVQDEDMVEVKVNGQSIKSVAWIMPGQADNTVVLHLGYGRAFKNHIPYHIGKYNDSEITGFNVNPLRASASAFALSGGVVTKTGDTYVVAAVQRHDNSRQYSEFDVGKRPKLV
jgi:molybdopterin-containing oxidoreductase family iron-sulfur binding subunit